MGSYVVASSSIREKISEAAGDGSSVEGGIGGNRRHRRWGVVAGGFAGDISLESVFLLIRLEDVGGIIQSWFS